MEPKTQTDKAKKEIPVLDSLALAMKILPYFGDLKYAEKLMLITSKKTQKLYKENVERFRDYINTFKKEEVKNDKTEQRMEDSEYQTLFKHLEELNSIPVVSHFHDKEIKLYQRYKEVPPNYFGFHNVTTKNLAKFTNFYPYTPDDVVPECEAMLAVSGIADKKGKREFQFVRCREVSCMTNKGDVVLDTQFFFIIQGGKSLNIENYEIIEDEKFESHLNDLPIYDESLQKDKPILVVKKEKCEARLRGTQKYDLTFQGF
jgi:hypothetical protein